MIQIHLTAIVVRKCFSFCKSELCDLNGIKKWIWGFMIRADVNLKSNTIISNVFWYFLNYTKDLMFYKMRVVGFEITFLWNKALIFIIIINLFFNY